MNVYSSHVMRRPYAETSQAPLAVSALMGSSWIVKTFLAQVCYIDPLVGRNVENELNNTNIQKTLKFGV